MTEQEKIEALKKNEKPFGLMDDVLCDKAKKIGRGKFGVYSGNTKCAGFFYGNDRRGDQFLIELCYRLRSDYNMEPAEPDEIELKIGQTKSFMDIETGAYSTLYTNAPAFIPKPGYRFAGYRYEKWNDLCMFPVHNDDVLNKIVFPVAAVYRKLTS